MNKIDKPPALPQTREVVPVDAPRVNGRDPEKPAAVPPPPSK